MSGRAQLIQRSRQLKRRRKMFQLAGLIFLILLAIGLTAFALHRPRWRVNDVEVFGLKNINSTDIVNLVNQETSGSHFWFIPKNSRFFYPEKKLKQALLLNFPRLGSVSFERDGQRVNVNITERESALLWCLDGGEQSDCYFVDNLGVAFAKAPNFADNVLFEVHQNFATNTDKNYLGAEVLSTQTLIAIYSQKEVIQKVLAGRSDFSGHSVVGVEIDTDAVYIFNISVAGKDQAWQVLTRADISADRLEKLMTALFDSDSFIKNVFKTKRQLAYVDARLSNKVFFKLKDNNHAPAP